MATVIVPYTSNPDFVGRSAILQRLKHHFPLRHQQKAVTSQARAALWGLGGIGYVSEQDTWDPAILTNSS